MCAVLVERHGLGGASIDLCSTSLDLEIPRSRGIGFGFSIEAADQLECKARTLAGRQAQELAEHVDGSHGYIVAGPRA
jgi:hypothetical protein